MRTSQEVKYCGDTSKAAEHTDTERRMVVMRDWGTARWAAAQGAQHLAWQEVWCGAGESCIMEYVVDNTVP